ncbi:uncharacterized protein LOC141849594 [Brevipalpus obovatus]|uniref:uncharacterized protein LOC141849594 n=1 Tax=Brevipalpus obovatus TaxID=246614 RepID=UPI003D9F48F5
MSEENGPPLECEPPKEEKIGVKLVKEEFKDCDAFGSDTNINDSHDNWRARSSSSVSSSTSGPVFVFTTALANKAADAVRKGMVQSLSEFARAQPETKRLLEENLNKMQQTNLENSWHKNFAQQPQQPHMNKSLNSNLGLRQPGNSASREKKLAKLAEISSILQNTSHQHNQPPPNHILSTGSGLPSGNSGLGSGSGPGPGPGGGFMDDNRRRSCPNHANSHASPMSQSSSTLSSPNPNIAPSPGTNKMVSGGPPPPPYHHRPLSNPSPHPSNDMNSDQQCQQQQQIPSHHTQPQSSQSQAPQSQQQAQQCSYGAGMRMLSYANNAPMPPSDNSPSLSMGPSINSPKSGPPSSITPTSLGPSSGSSIAPRTPNMTQSNSTSPSRKKMKTQSYSQDQSPSVLNSSNNPPYLMDNCNSPDLCKGEPQLMPVPSPRQIQYLDTLGGQELIIQREANKCLIDSGSLLPSDIDAGFPNEYPLHYQPNSIENGNGPSGRVPPYNNPVPTSMPNPDNCLMSSTINSPKPCPPANPGPNNGPGGSLTPRPPNIGPPPSHSSNNMMQSNTLRENGSMVPRNIDPNFSNDLSSSQFPPNSMDNGPPRFMTPDNPMNHQYLNNPPGCGPQYGMGPSPRFMGGPESPQRFSGPGFDGGQRMPGPRQMDPNSPHMRPTNPQMNCGPYGPQPRMDNQRFMNPRENYMNNSIRMPLDAGVQRYTSPPMTENMQSQFNPNMVTHSMMSEQGPPFPSGAALQHTDPTCMNISEASEGVSSPLQNLQKMISPYEAGTNKMSGPPMPYHQGPRPLNTPHPSSINVNTSLSMQSSSSNSNVDSSRNQPPPHHLQSQPQQLQPHSQHHGQYSYGNVQGIRMSHYPGPGATGMPAENPSLPMGPSMNSPKSGPPMSAGTNNMAPSNATSLTPRPNLGPPPNSMIQPNNIRENGPMISRNIDSNFPGEFPPSQFPPNSMDNGPPRFMTPDNPMNHQYLNNPPGCGPQYGMGPSPRFMGGPESPQRFSGPGFDGGQRMPGPRQMDPNSPHMRPTNPQMNCGPYGPQPRMDNQRFMNPRENYMNNRMRGPMDINAQRYSTPSHQPLPPCSQRMTYNGAPTIQVKPNAPNTIQYLPNRPMMSNQGQANPNRPPNSEFIYYSDTYGDTNGGNSGQWLCQ